MSCVISAFLGYLLGCLSPSALFGKMKKTDLRKKGTGNLGATNTTLVLGKKYGFAVMVFDIFKAYMAVKIAKMLFPRVAIAGVVAGGFAVVGHIYPFYMRFKGGKGLAAFGGFVLVVDSMLFLGLLTVSVVSVIIVNYTVAMPISAGILFPFLYYFKTGELVGFIAVLLVSAVLIANHIPNVHRIKRGEDVRVREFFKEKLGGK